MTAIISDSSAEPYFSTAIFRGEKAGVAGEFTLKSRLLPVTLGP